MSIILLEIVDTFGLIGSIRPWKYYYRIGTIGSDEIGGHRFWNNPPKERKLNTYRSLDWFFREHLQETMVFVPTKYAGKSCIFSPLKSVPNLDSRSGLAMAKAVVRVPNCSCDMPKCWIKVGPILRMDCWEHLQEPPPIFHGKNHGKNMGKNHCFL